MEQCHFFARVCLMGNDHDYAYYLGEGGQYKVGAEGTESIGCVQGIGTMRNEFTFKIGDVFRVLRCPLETTDVLIKVAGYEFPFWVNAERLTRFQLQQIFRRNPSRTTSPSTPSAA